MIASWKYIKKYFKVWLVILKLSECIDGLNLETKCWTIAGGLYVK